MPDQPPIPPSAQVEHALKNHLAVILGFCDLLLADLPETSSARQDVLEIQKAAASAMALVAAPPAPPS